MRFQKSLFAMCCLMAALVAGCGSSSYSPSSGSSGPTSMNGAFVDAPVVGMTYSCGSYSNQVTGAGGSFSCPSGSMVTFSIGGITICKAPVQAVMTPVSCAQANGNASASASTPSVYELAQFLLSINTTPASPPAFPTTITITPAEITAAASLSLNFSTATQTELQTAVTAINGATLVNATYAQNALTITVVAAVAGSYAGTYAGTGAASGTSGTWSVTIASNGTVSGTATDNTNKMFTVTGSLTSGTSYAGTSGSANWSGTVDTSKSPYTFSGNWTNGSIASGTFTGTKM